MAQAEDESFFSDAPVVREEAPVVAGGLAELMASFEQRINALTQLRQGGAGRGDRVAGLTPELIKKLQSEGKCFRCKQSGHMKNECPQKPKSKNA